MEKIRLFLFVSILTYAVTNLKGTDLFAHCDTMNGPVISAAKEALNKGDVRLVLIWVQEKDEDLVTDLFNQTVKLRSLNAEVKKMADTHFFENLVRIHRAGEGVAYTGIKEAGEVEVPIEASDKALESGSSDAVMKMLQTSVKNGVKERFDAMMSKKNFNKTDVKAGREFVESYVSFMHYVEGIYNVAQSGHGLHGQKVSEINPEDHH